ncbi:MAG: PIG-L family deacetylase [Gemmatimonadaceae bacterium]|nr:PIG-L family deacetylase [Gemmatimonadaceae bacterium]
MSRAFGVALIALASLAPSLGAQEHGASALVNAVKLLGADTPRVLYIAAHPDDEDPRLIAYLSRGGRAEVAYLSLTRGEGGANLIGDELGDALGVLRTQELLAGRRIDGARQYFTRAYDFGFSKSAAEAYTHWPRDSLLNDVIRVVRAFRPHVIVATFSGTPRDNHGQHQVSGRLARDAYDLADDVARFPIAQFGAPWTPLKLYRNAGFFPDGPHLAINVGEYDPLSGMSLDEIASRTRSQHKSQGVRENHRLGDVTIRYYREASRLTPEVPREQETSILDGLSATSRQSSNGPGGDAFARELDVRSPASAIPFIARHAPRAESERARYDRAGIAATGLAFEAIAPRTFVAIGDSIVLDYALHNRGTIAVRIDSAAGAFPSETVAPGRTVRWKATLRPAHRLQPWWLQRPRAGDMFATPPPTQSDDELAQADWPRIRVSVAGLPQPVAISARPVYRLLEGFYGDTIAPLVAAPGLTVTPAQGMAVARAGSRLDRDFYVTVMSSFDSERRVTVDVELPPGLSATPSSAEVVIPAGARRTVAFRIAGSMPPGAHRLRLRAKSNGEVFDESVRAVAYPHVFPQAMYAPAGITLHAVPVDVPVGLRVGYIAGKADFGPQVLTDLGVPVTLIEPAEIPRIDLSRFSVIVVGPRMYEASADLVEHNGRLLEYAGNGGRLVVQFGQYMMANAGILPYPITISRPRPGVTDENAPVVITDPAARELTYPNRITLADFDGWVQERAAFIPSAFDPRYRTMIAMNDPGEQPVQSSILVAPVGRGTHVYTTLALFRQLEEGVPGAVRLFVNLLSP